MQSYMLFHLICEHHFSVGVTYSYKITLVDQSENYVGSNYRLIWGNIFYMFPRIGCCQKFRLVEQMKIIARRGELEDFHLLLTNRNAVFQWKINGSGRMSYYAYWKCAALLCLLV